MTSCFFVSDLHGRPNRYEALWQAILDEAPSALFLGGDLFSHHIQTLHSGSGEELLIGGFRELKTRMRAAYPRVFIILGNDDSRYLESRIVEAAAEGLWEYAHRARLDLESYRVFGYSCVPPTPFNLKDWERYDVSRYVDPGCVSPEEGYRTVAVDPDELRYGTIQKDLEDLLGNEDLSRAILLLHSPPYQTNLDRAALDGKRVDHVPMDLHVGSIAIRRLIENRQPLLTLHGHVHESARLTGSWKEKIGNTLSLSAAHDGPELALVRFDLENLAAANRELL